MNKSILYGIGGLIIGVLISGFFFSNQASTTTSKTQTMQHDMSKMNMEQGMTMDDMVNGLKGKTGDDFDKAFLLGMIEHHQGAIDMAKLAQKDAKHEEIKSMADDIISAQTREINQMNEWKKSWSY